MGVDTDGLMLGKIPARDIAAALRKTGTRARAKVFKSLSRVDFWREGYNGENMIYVHHDNITPMGNCTKISLRLNRDNPGVSVAIVEDILKLCGGGLLCPLDYEGLWRFVEPTNNKED